MTVKKISRKAFLQGSGASALLLMSGSRAAERDERATRGRAGDGRPNILFVCMDQLRSLLDVPEKLPLPAFRRLLRDGRSFRNYHVHQAPCGPSRSTFYTGQHVQKTGMYTNPVGEYGAYTPGSSRGVELPPAIPTIGTMLREQGYYTAYKGKWHLSVVNQKIGAAAFPSAAKSLEPYGFADYNFDGEHTGLTWAGFGRDGVTAAESVNLLERFAAGSTRGRPWFLAVNFINPHDIMFFDSRNDGAALLGTPTLAAPATPLYEKDWGFALPHSYRADDLSQKPSTQRSFRKLDEEQLRVYQNYYFNCIRDVDQHLGDLLNAVERLGLASNTIVIATADHGERAGAHGGNVGKGADLYKETVRVPLIVRHPDVRVGGETSALACGVDLAPTLLGFAGLADRERSQRYPALHGVDVRAAIADNRARTTRDERGILFNYCTPPGRFGGSESATSAESRALIRGVFDGRYKFGRYFRINEHHEPRDWETLVAHNDLELYDTRQDPDELANLAFQPEAQRERIMELNAKVNALVEAEIGVDDGSIYPGATGSHVLGSSA